MKSMGIVAIVLMILALIAYVMTNDESVTPNDNREAMPATSE
jgi:Na+-transporting methylmalonyl-CoA/oxaloacetate decarboxylase gamma subunit